MVNRKLAIGAVGIDIQVEDTNPAATNALRIQTFIYSNFKFKL